MKPHDLSTAGALNLEHYWMPFTDNRRFRAKPRLVAAAKDMYYTTTEGRQVLDGLATLWCVNAGHSRPRILAAIPRQAGGAHFASSFSPGPPPALPPPAPRAGPAPPRPPLPVCPSAWCA